jgi:outer membrane protein TolC
MDAAKQGVVSAQESYDLAVGRFKAGYGINLDVLDAESALATARSNLVQAVLNYNQSQVQLVQALGLVTPTALISGIATQGTSSNGNTSLQP